MARRQDYSPSDFGNALAGAFGGSALAGKVGAVLGAATAGPVGMAIAGAMALKEGFGSLRDSVVSLRDPVAMLGQHIQPFIASVAKWNPGGVERMQLAFDNLSAAAGRMFNPIIEAARGFADELNTLYTSLAPAISGLAADIAGPVRDAARGFAVGVAGAVREAIPMVRAFVTEMVPAGRALGEMFKSMFAASVPLAKAFLDVFNILTPFNVQLEGAGSALTTFAIKVAVISEQIGDASKRISGWIGGGSGSGMGGTLMTAANWMTSLGLAGNVIGALAGGESFAQREARIRAQQTSSALTGPMTYAAQPARHVGIEDVGMEARRSAFSQGSSVAEQTAANTAASATNTAAILLWLQTNAPTLLASTAPVGVMG